MRIERRADRVGLAQPRGRDDQAERCRRLLLPAALLPSEVDPLAEAVALSGVEPTPETCRQWLQQAREAMLNQIWASEFSLREWQSAEWCGPDALPPEPGGPLSLMDAALAVTWARRCPRTARGRQSDGDPSGATS